MQAKALRDLDDGELAKQLATLRQELFGLRFANATGELVLAQNHGPSYMTGINGNLLAGAQKRLRECPHPLPPLAQEVVGTLLMARSLPLWLTHSDDHSLSTTHDVGNAVHLDEC